MGVSRSPQMWLVAYFLSRCGRRRADRPPFPPTQLATDSWEEAYGLFFPRLCGGRRFRVFHHSMKNARDTFDGHHDSGRIGWREPGAERSPRPLSHDAQAVLEEWRDRPDAELWLAVQQHVDLQARGLNAVELERLV